MKSDTLNLTINVTKQDYDKGVGGDCARCPVSLALIRALKKKKFKFSGVSVDACDLYIYSNSRDYYSSASHRISEFVEFFDDFKELKNKFDEEIDDLESRINKKFISLEKIKVKEKFKPFSIKLAFNQQ